MKRNDIIVALLILTIYASSKTLKLKNPEKIVDSPKIVISKAIIDSRVKAKQVYLNPLQLRSPSLVKEPARLILIRDIKLMFETMLRSYFHLTKKFRLKSLRKNRRNVPRRIECKNFSNTIHKPSYIHGLYRDFYDLKKENYWTKPRTIINSLQSIMLEVGNNCAYIIEYIDFFKDLVKRQRYLKLKGFHNPWLLLQVLSTRLKFINSWGKYAKMGHYLGNLFAWYKIYNPKYRIMLLGNR